MKSVREQAEAKRQAKLDLVREQVENGSLVIRPMTAEERRRYPPRPAKVRRSNEPDVDEEHTSGVDEAVGGSAQLTGHPTSESD
jgi:hypothetical protein